MNSWSDWVAARRECRARLRMVSHSSLDSDREGGLEQRHERVAIVAAQEPGAEARIIGQSSGRPMALQSLAQNDWLPQARKNHSPSPAWYSR